MLGRGYGIAPLPGTQFKREWWDGSRIMGGLATSNFLTDSAERERDQLIW